MKRLKRNPIDRAFVRGYQNGLTGKSKDSCPFSTAASRHAWLTGWREGRGDHWDGFKGAAGLHRFNLFNAVG